MLARALMATQGLTPEVASAYEQVLSLFERGDQSRQQYWVLRGLASVYMLRTEFGKSRELGRRILELAEQEDDPNMRIDGHLIFGANSAFGGDLRAGSSTSTPRSACSGRVPRGRPGPGSATTRASRP